MGKKTLGPLIEYKMIKIFAKYNTAEKVAILLPPSKGILIQTIKMRLEKKFGGAWYAVDEISDETEIILFYDALIYRGFEVEQERYCNSIKPLKA
jgi:hypothetical protein